MEKYFDQAVESIQESVRFDSSLATPEAGMPFGKGAYDCLHHFLALAEKLGFQTNNYDNYVGEVLFGDAEEEFAILAHLDVVPAGGNWTHDPFGGELSDGKIWGRGTVDDKGPAICCLYALKALKDEGFQPNKKIKLIVGCNEESGWGCIEHYKKCAKLPETGFSPDADFPVIYAEKGIMHLRFHFPVAKAPFLSLEGGKSANMVCDYCEVVPRVAVDLTNTGLTMQEKKIISIGKSAHGSTPGLGKNAILPVLELFREKNADVNRVIECLFEDVHGLRQIKDETGSLTVSPDIIKFRKGMLDIVCDIRYPATVALSAVLNAVNQFGVKYETLHHQLPLFHEKNSKLITTLLEVYKEFAAPKQETDEAEEEEEIQPVAIGGGTYARALKNGVAFGPEMKGDEAVIHQPNEYITLDRVKLLLNIYKAAVERLMQ